MRKFLITALAAGSIIGTGALVSPILAAEPSASCATALPTGGVSAGPGGVTVCSTVGVNGSVSAAGDPSTQQGYVVADGDSTNQGPTAGYIGISSAPGDDANNPAGIVSCSGQQPDPNNPNAQTGPGHPNYNPAGGNNSFDPAGDPSTGPCAAHQ